MIRLIRRQLDKAVADAGRPAGSVKLVSNTWFYLLRPGETWEDGVGNGFGSGPISSCIGVMLSNPFTAERDVADIGSSILAHV